MKYTEQGTEQIGIESWRELQDVARVAYHSALRDSRTTEEIDYFLSWGNITKFAGPRINPNVSVGERLFSGNEYKNSRIVIANTDMSEPVGYGLIADNVSGNAAERLLKWRITSKRYAWIQELVVHPDEQRSGVASTIGRVLLETADKDQPVSAYVFEELTTTTETLKQFGFEDRGFTAPVEVFGAGTKPTRYNFLRADSVSSVLNNL